LLCYYEDIKPIETEMSDSMQYKLRETFQDDNVALFQIAGGACTAALTTLIIAFSS
jgi:hypothetical protein